VQCAGYNYLRTSWEAAENQGNADELVDEFHWEHRNNPQRWWKSEGGSGLHVSYSFLYILDAGPVTMALARVLPPPELSQVEVELPCGPDARKSGLNGTDRW
jgi:hypothetical protein